MEAARKCAAEFFIRYRGMRNEEGYPSVENTKKRFVKNLSYAVLAQCISLIMSVVMSLVAPKLLGVKAFAYWQLFIFYSGFANFFHFGVNDGVFIRLGGQDYSELDHRQLSGEIRAAMLAQSCLLLVGALGCGLFLRDGDRLFVFIMSGIYVVVYNLTTLYGMIFQAVNQGKVFAKALILCKSLFLVVAIFLLLMPEKDYHLFILFDVASWFAALAYLAWQGKELTRAPKCRFSEIWETLREDISVGSKLMLASVASGMIIGTGRMMVDSAWGIETFGKFSFALSLSNILLLFIHQISTVLFPELKRLTGEKQDDFFSATRLGLDLLLPVFLLLYVPIKIVMGLWLPDYQESLTYMTFLFPLCVYDVKMQMLYNTYFKIYRKEKTILWLNAGAVTLSLILSLISVYLVHNIILTTACMLITIILRNTAAEIELAKIMKYKVTSGMLLNIAVTIAFVLSVHYAPNDGMAFVAFLLVYVCYLAVRHNDVRFFFRRIRNAA